MLFQARSSLPLACIYSQRYMNLVIACGPSWHKADRPVSMCLTELYLCTPDFRDFDQGQQAKGSELSHAASQALLDGAELSMRLKITADSSKQAWLYGRKVASIPGCVGWPTARRSTRPPLRTFHALEVPSESRVERGRTVSALKAAGNFIGLVRAKCAWYKFFPTEAKELHRPRYHCRKDFFILQPASAHLTKAHGWEFSSQLSP